MKGLVFDEAQHRYLLHGFQLPSVTQVLEATGHIKTRFYAAGSGKADFGTAVHDTTALIDCGLATAADYHDPDVQACLLAWEGIKALLKASITGVEVRVCSRRALYAGTLDRLAVTKQGLTLIDLKTGQKAGWHGLQVEAYAEALEEETGEQIESLIIAYLSGTKRTPYQITAIKPIERPALAAKWQETLEDYYHE